MQTFKRIYKNNNNELCFITPKELKNQFVLSKKNKQFISVSRQIISKIIHRLDKRFLIICGPCSIHDVNSATDYAKRLKKLSDKLGDQLYIVMRVYLEKPRTTVGWKGLINDPYMDSSYNIDSGLKIARSLLLELIDIGLPLATEVLDSNISQYLSDCFSWSAIGARTTESQIHREIASGLCMPVGFKNSTDGSVSTAINSIYAASVPHCFLGINEHGYISLLHTKGNCNVHIILRGGKCPNYYQKDVFFYEKQIMNAGFSMGLMIDCSHGNSNKNYLKQLDVVESILSQIECGNRSIFGLMLESHIYSGSQDLVVPINNIKYGISITDSCIDWDTTEKILHRLHTELKPFLSSRL